MNLYNIIFLILKLSILFFYTLHVFKLIDYTPKLEILLEDTFNLFVGVFAIYIFWPYKNITITYHDKWIAVAAGILILISINYRKIYHDFID